MGLATATAVRLEVDTAQRRFACSRCHSTPWRERWVASDDERTETGGVRVRYASLPAWVRRSPATAPFPGPYLVARRRGDPGPVLLAISDYLARGRAQQ